MLFLSGHPGPAHYYSRPKRGESFPCENYPRRSSNTVSVCLSVSNGRGFRGEEGGGKMSSGFWESKMMEIADKTKRGRKGGKEGWGEAETSCPTRNRVGEEFVGGGDYCFRDGGKKERGRETARENEKVLSLFSGT